MAGTREAWQKRLSVLVPAFNEEGGVGRTLTDLRTRLPEAEIIVIDDYSTDATAQEASRIAGVRVVRHAYNCGYGGALKTGMVLAKREYVAWFDADGEHLVEDLVRIVDRLDRDRLVAVIGQRRRGSKTRLRAVGKWLIRAVARSLDFRGGADLNCGLRVFRRDIINRYLYVLPEGYSASLTSLMVMLERRYPVAFEPVEVGPRTGVSKVRISDGVSTLALVVRMAMLFAPLRVFFRSGVLIGSAGLLYSIALSVSTGAGLPVAGALASLAGLMLIAVGLIADQISQLRLIQLASIASLPHRPVLSDTGAGDSDD
jgi:glycosyltransferase involved in cell wall biosynthesis